MYLKLMRRFALAATLLLGVLDAYAMPTKAQLDEVKPIVQELMAPLVRDYKAKKKLAAEVADGAMALVAEADSEAAKFALIKGAVFYYTRAKAYDKAADAIESLVRHIPDIPAPTLYEITSKAAANTTARTAPRLAALNAAAKKRAAVATRRASVAKELRKAPADLRLLRLDAELAAASGDWDAALAQFAKLGMAHERARGASPEGMRDTARIAAADADATGSDAEIADFWWNYTPAASEAKDAIRAHAADLYRRAIDSGALDGLKLTLAEKRIAEVDATDTPTAIAAASPYAAALRRLNAKEVEFIEATGTQWTDTGIIPTQNTSAQFRVMNRKLTGCVILGYDAANDNQDWRIFNHQEKIFFDVWNRRLNTPAPAFAENVWHEFEIGNYYVKDLGSGATLLANTPVPPFKGIASIMLNHATHNGTSSCNRWGYVKVFDDGKLVRDFIPVRIGSEGYMFDRVSQKLFGNSGTGAFLVGPDVSR